MKGVFIFIGAGYISGWLVLPEDFFDIFLVLLLSVAILVTLAESHKRE